MTQSEKTPMNPTVATRRLLELFSPVREVSPLSTSLKPKTATSLFALALAGCVTPFAPPPTTVSVGGDVQVAEGGQAVVPIIKTGNGSAKFSYSTTPGTADATDFVSVSGNVTTSGDATLVIRTTPDGLVEGPESFRVLIGPKGQTTVADAESVVTIADDDVAPPQPITCWDGSQVVPPATCPEQPPAPIDCGGGITVIPPATCPPPVIPPTSGNIPSNGLTGLAPIPSVDPALAVKAASIPGSGAPDVVGAFRLTCGFAGLGRFDPKVVPGDTTGKSHGHQFYGNTSVTPTSTYQSLRTAGPSTCSYGAYPGNRSAYWQPWLEDGAGGILQPDLVTLYYKRRPPNDPICSDPNHPQYSGKCVDMPTGMFYIFGFDFITNTPPTGQVDFTCIDPATNVQTVFKTLTEAANSGKCKPGGKFSSRANGPPCWDGAFVDTTNHRNHVAYGSYGSWGYYKCPSTHPYVIPQVSVLSQWTIQSGADLTRWAFSSDYQRPDLPRGTTFHVDFWFLWEPQIAINWHGNCIAKLLNCSGGNIGNGTALNSAGQPIYPDPATGQPRYYWVNPYPVRPIPGAEANTKLIGINGGPATFEWVSRKPKGKPTPQPFNPALDRFDRPGAGDIEQGAPLPPPPPGTPPHNHGERG